MPRKIYRKYTFKVKRSKFDPEIKFTTTAKNDKEAINRLEKRLQMTILEMDSVTPESVSKPIHRKESYIFTKEDVVKIKKDAVLSKQSTINLVPFPYLHEGTLRTMIKKLKRGVKI